MIPLLKRESLLSRIKYYLIKLVRLESFGGIVLMLLTVLALVIANSSCGETFLAFWERHAGFEFGSWRLNKTLIHWINDGLMAIFFFVVGLEIKREMLTGDLSSLKEACLPILAAVGGMLLPALIYMHFNKAGVGVNGWGVPMATDIAFALGILILLGKRVPLSLKLLLASIAIVDDIGAVIVIALFYTSEIDWMYLVYGGGIYALLWGLNFFEVRTIRIYMFLGIILWYFLLKSGVHATLAGILLAFTIPVRANCEVVEFIQTEASLLNLIAKIPVKSSVSGADKRMQARIDTLEANCKRVISPLQRVEHVLSSWVVYLIVPLFAFANAGVIINNELLEKISEPIPMGIILGLFLGKPLGIFLFSFFSVKLGVAKKPIDVSWRQILGIGFLGGIGFTMSFFVSQLAFADAAVLDLAKIAVLIGSLCSAFIGFLVLRFLCGASK